MSVLDRIPVQPVLKEVNNVGHLFLLVITLGLWFPVYIFDIWNTPRINRKRQEAYSWQLSAYNMDMYSRRNRW